MHRPGDNFENSAPSPGRCGAHLCPGDPARTGRRRAMPGRQPWRQVIRGRRHECVFRVVDTHVHYGDYEGIPYISVGFEQVLEATREAGTEAMVFVSTFEQLVPGPVEPERILRGNEDLLRHVEREPDCWMMAVFHPSMPEVVSQARELIRDEKCLGLKCGPWYHRYDMAGPAGRTVFEFMAEHGVPAVIHTNDDEYDHPARILRVAEQYPQARVLLAHFNSLHPHTGHSELLSQRNCPNVWLGLDHADCVRYGLIEACVDIVGADRIIYGSDAPCYYPRSIVAAVTSTRLSSEDKQKILAGNAERFLGRKLTGSRES